MIFATFNGLAFIHMFLTAPETKGKTLEEMDDVFDSGRPAWKSVPKESKLDRLVEDIEKGHVKVKVDPARQGSVEVVQPAEGTLEKHAEAPKTETTV
jgi:hypothetical protein